MTTIAYIILKVESMIKKPIMTNHTFFAVVTFSKINSFTYINSIVIEHLYNIVFAISNRKTKTSELITKLFLIESNHVILSRKASQF